LVLSSLLHVSAFLKCYDQGGWELYIVTGGVMVAIISFSASHYFGNLSRIIFDSLMMAF
jgi:hypothetical protein